MYRQLRININLDIPNDWDVDIKSDELENPDAWTFILATLTGNEKKMNQHININVKADSVMSTDPISYSEMVDSDNILNL